MIRTFMFMLVGYFIWVGLVMLVFFAIPALQSGALMTYSIIGMIILLGVPPFFFSAPFKIQGKREMEILQNGYPGKATVVALEDTGVTINENPMIKMTLDIQPEMGSPFQVNVKAMVSRVAIPRVGDSFPVKYDPNDHTKVTVVPQEMASTTTPTSPTGPT